MTLPKAVVAQAEAADAAQKELIGNTNTPETPTTPEVPEPEAGKAQDVQPETPEPIQASDTEIDWQQRAEAAEQRYRVLQGKYNAEVKKGQEPNTDQGQIAHLEAQIAQLRNELSAAQPQQPSPNEAPTFSEAELKKLAEDYGEDFVKDFGRMVDSRVETMVQQRMAQVDTQVSQLSHQQKLNLLTQRLQQFGIDFNQVNSDPLFLQWLDEVDPFTGAPRQRLLSAAFDEAGDIERTTLFFRQFVESAPTQTPNANIPTPDQLAQVKPKAPQQPVPAEQSVWSENAIAELYKQAALGKVSEAELQQREREIFASLYR
ncbi:hypothetical protein [Ferrimonas balearica]|uniref:hypothetical protein n=1 Tax=Ferrimonas balearica TaxID=44012 RepID=UPI001F2A10EA|nr:hypothetical protein [Ferrimonas balearica]MBY6093854.1 hypothetical protein [Ferrimonas balearica]